MINRQSINLNEIQINDLTNVLERFGVVSPCQKELEKQMFNELIKVAICSLDYEQSEKLLNSL